MEGELNLQKSYKVKEVAKILSLNPQSVLERIWDGKLLAYKDEKEWRVMGRDIEEYRESLRSKKQPVYQGGTMLKVVKTGKSSWKAGFGGFSFYYDSKGIKRWKIWWYDSKDNRKFKHMNTDDSKIPERIRIARVWSQVTNEKEAFIALKAELERERTKAFAQKVASYDPEQGAKLIKALGIEEEGKRNSVRLEKLIDDYVANYAKLNLKSNGYMSTLKYWKERFGKKRAEELTKGNIIRLFAEEQKEAQKEGRDIKRLKLHRTKKVQD